MTPDNSVPLDSDLAKTKFALLYAVMSIEVFHNQENLFLSLTE